MKRSHRPKSAPASAAHAADIPFDLPRVTPAQRQRAHDLMIALHDAYPDAGCELNFGSPHELLVATILSAQATDVSVNKATPALFARFPTPAAYAAATPGEIEPLIKTIGLFRNKAKAIHSAMKDVVERFNDCVPQTMEELLTLRGVARKTANVVLGNAFGINVGFVVDTHVLRLAERLCLAPARAKVHDVEKRLMALFPRQSWCNVSHYLIWHGRRACKARGVPCDAHPICTTFGACCELRVTAPRRPRALAAGSSARSSGPPTSMSASRRR